MLLYFNRFELHYYCTKIMLTNQNYPNSVEQNKSADEATCTYSRVIRYYLLRTEKGKKLYRTNC